MKDKFTAFPHTYLVSTSDCFSSLSGRLGRTAVDLLYLFLQMLIFFNIFFTKDSLIYFVSV